MPNEWTKRRSDLNHGRLGNQFRTTLGSVVNVLEGKARWFRSKGDLLAECVSEWKNISAEASALLKDFESEMSPRRCFDSPPLCNCDSETKSWLPSVIHELWMRRYPVKAWITEAQASLAEADRACNEMNDQLGKSDFTNSQTVEAILPMATAFQDACDILVEKISKFPHSIRM